MRRREGDATRSVLNGIFKAKGKLGMTKRPKGEIVY